LRERRVNGTEERVQSPYRHVEAAKAQAPKSGELVYRPQGRTDRFAAGYSGFRMFGPPAVVGCVVGWFWSQTAGVIAFCLLVGRAIWLSRKKPKDVIVLRVDDGLLTVRPMGSEMEAFSVRLVDLHDVVLDTKSVQRVLETSANVVNIGMGPLTPSVASATDTNRIALETATRKPYALTEEYFGHGDTTEWFAKVRVFLRSVGWTPLAEREDDSET
jgi:hypothetical protein